MQLRQAAPALALEQPAPESQPSGQSGGWAEQAEPGSHCQSQAHELSQLLTPAQLLAPPHSTLQAPLPHVMSPAQLLEPVQVTAQRLVAAHVTSRQASVPEQMTWQSPALSQ